MLQEIVEQRFGGFAEDGSKIYSRTFTGRYAVTCLADWREMRLSQSGGHDKCGCPFGTVLRAFLDAAVGGGDYRPAVAAGSALDAHDRYRVLRVLDGWAAGAADEYPPAQPVARAMRAAWARKWGDKAPRAVVRA